jgi:putative hemolysin
MVPKNIYQRKSDTLVYSSARAFYICNLFFLPFVKALSLLTGAVNLFFGRRRTLESEFLTRKSVERHLTEGSGESVLTPAQVEMVRNILGLAAKRVSDAMIVLNEAVMIGVDADAACVARLVGKHGFSRMPAYRGSRANIVGVLNVFDVFYESAGASGDAPRTIEHLVRPVPFIGRDARIDQALASLREARQPMGVVVGARSEPLGIVTIKDLLEEITGEIRNW